MSESQKALGLYLSLFLPFVLAVFMDSLGYKFFSIVTVTGITIAILLAPIRLSLMMALVFISFQGFFKVVSDYHPIVHLGADLVVIALVVKVILGRFSGKIPDHFHKPPFLALFSVHFAWVAITYLNPYSLSVISNIAGSKVYVSMILLYFFGFYLVNSRKDLHQFFLLFVVLAMIHTIFAVYQGLLGPESVLSIHPSYANQLLKYRKTAFRPFGLTHVPGGPSVYIYTSLSFMVYAIYEFRSYLLRALVFLTIPFSGLALMMCQVRSAIIKAIFTVGLFDFAQPFTKLYHDSTTQFRNILLGSLVIAASLVTIPYLMNMAVEDYEDNERAFERSLSSFDLESLSVARQNSWDRFVLYAGKVPLGAGFARVGASAGAFKDITATDPYFPNRFFFADNLFITLLIELGFPGLIIVSLLVVALLWRGFKNIRVETRMPLIAPQLAIYAPLVAITIGSYGGEGIIYNPESCFFWFFSGVLMRLQIGNFAVKVC